MLNMACLDLSADDGRDHLPRTDHGDYPVPAIQTLGEGSEIPPQAGFFEGGAALAVFFWLFEFFAFFCSPICTLYNI